MTSNHNKIITQAAREILRPRGLFQKGQSRVWIDDNGWFLIIVEFQPSAWDKGAYLNVAINYLWDRKDYLSFDYGHRVKEFVAFKGDEATFYSKMLALAQEAFSKVEEYRQFGDLKFAQDKILHCDGHSSLSKELYNKMMICGLRKDSHAGALFRKLTDYLSDAQLGWEKAYYFELSEHISPIISDKDMFCRYIIGKIEEQRAYWRSRSSMKKLCENWEL